MIGHVSMIYICVVCCLLCVVYAQQATEVGKNVTAMAASCPRDVARRVRDYLFDDIFSALSISAMDLPPSCPLHPSRDLYGDQEKHKYEVHRGEWRVSVFSVLECLRCTHRSLPASNSAHTATKDSSVSFTWIDIWKRCIQNILTMKTTPSVSQTTVTCLAVRSTQKTEK